ncbi:hypothetical protein MACK_002089 [Theileria orientalis]|uniref:ERCC4 domain-containing protein n=1 Tax=Theileria orientalis TaxID=68886 RepID=A0A976MBL7_THEOR|nr:hypothetical protein MACK_002089 [Theileria orientalis]
MPPLYYEKAILRSFVPTWRENLILYLKNGSLDKKTCPNLNEILGTCSRTDSEFHNGLIIVSSGVNIDRLLFYLLFYIANPLHVYENEGFSENIKECFKDSTLLEEELKQECESLLDNYDKTERCVESKRKCYTKTTSKKRNSYEITNRVKKEFEPSVIENDKSSFRHEGDSSSQDGEKVDELYDCPSLAIINSKLSLKSNAIYRKIFSMCEPPRPAKIWERSFLFTDVKVQSTVTMYTHLVFILGFELSDFENYQLMSRDIMGRLFVRNPRARKSSSVDSASAPSEAEEDVHSYIRLPKLEYIDGNVLATARQQLYVNGGYYVINSRILLNDLLSGKILPEIIAGIVVMNAHQIMEEYNIAFVVRLLRMRNKLAFVKAISDSVASFKGNNLSFCLKNIFTKNVHIYPRCHHLIESVLNDSQIQPLTFEVFLPLSDNATSVYKSILKMIWTVVESMKRLKYDIDMNKVVYTTYKGLIRILDKQVTNINVYQLYLNTTSGGGSQGSTSTSSSTSGVSYYIDTLLKFRILLDSLLYMDPISFVEKLEKMKNDNPDWLCTPNGIKLFKKSNERLFKIDDENIELNIEKNLKNEYIRDLFQLKLTNEQLIQMLKSNFKFHYHKRNKYRCRNYYNKRLSKQNISVDYRRRRLVATEASHLSYLTSYFKAGKKLRRNILIVVENYYLVEYLTKYYKYDVHMSKLLNLMQINLVSEVARNEGVSSSIKPSSAESFSAEYYSNINKNILSNNNIWNLYKHLVDTNTVPFEISSNSSYSNTQTSNVNSNTQNESNMDSGNPALSTGEYTGVESRESTENPRVSEQEGDEDLLDYLDINVDFDDYVFNSINVIKSFSTVNAGKIDKYDRLMSTLLRLNPCIVIIYAPNVHVFRVIENYCALKFSRPTLYRKRLNFLQVHILSLRDCLETHRFTKSLKAELDAWSHVQTQKKSLVVRLDEAVLVNKRNYVGQAIVDTRELNSKLPFFLFNAGLQVISTVLEIGDYLVTRDLCIERKSLSDLYTSLNSARLSKQLSEMCSAYENPFLLIEFDENDKFHLSSVGEGKYGHNYIYVKLIITCCNFPKLRLIWSSSPQESANIIRHLKINRSEPDLITNEYLVKNFRNKSEKVTAIDTQSQEPQRKPESIGLRRPEFVKNRDALKILRNIPGVTTHNITQILTNAKSLLHLSEFGLNELCNFLPETEAKQIHDYFNMPIRSA